MSVRTLVKQERRDRILSRAQELISQKGFEGLSIRVLAARAEVSTPTIYNLVGNKEDILHCLGESIVQQLTEAYQSSANEDPIYQAKEIIQQAKQGEKQALATLERYYDRMARCLAQVINIVDPEVIVLGGGLSNVETLYNEVPRRLPRYVFSDTLNTQLKPPVHGDSSGVRGAAWLWPIATHS